MNKIVIRKQNKQYTRQGCKQNEEQKLDPHEQKPGKSDKILWNSNLLCHVDTKYSYH